MFEVKARRFDKPDPILLVDGHAEGALKFLLHLHGRKWTDVPVGPFKHSCLRKSARPRQRVVVEVHIMPAARNASGSTSSSRSVTWPDSAPALSRRRQPSR